MTLVSVGYISMYKKIKLMAKVIASSILFLSVISPARQIAQADENQSTFLLKLDCVDTGGGNWGYRSENISVGKAVYTSRIYMGPGDSFTGLTCRLQPNEKEVNFQKLQLAFGMRDNDRGSPNVNVNIYFDGVLVRPFNVSPGQAVSVPLDVTTVQNVSIETVCSSKFQYCDRVYFWDATLEIIP